eukprot:CAMPEP_0113701736 /NCGR_PEP_ID=MMETSP0038_2-20120614/24757_1 /TAXON_ID=2898 /ORGANISM="Cryptomonas paramecium" /LENGTH=324 /DNA_ID=CAMNT_0000625695 /DNA_START=331 /DNA_END=1302 /DNA_ORIENTATION=- /assembly_acc=CAM_ASM_000170
MNPHNEEVLQQLMETARRTNAWLVTGGSRAGIMKYVGEARCRFGGNIPLIGIATWGTTQQNELLGVDENAVNYGYLTRRPVNYKPAKYGKQSARPALDNNHSHFILVDDGSEGQFGREIDLRAQFEACACSPRGNPEERAIADVLRRKGIGWEGSQDGWIGAYQDFQGDNAAQDADKQKAMSLAVCLCMEGGPGTLATVAAATRNGTPVILMKGSGRAADLIADCIRVVQSEDDREDEMERVDYAGGGFDDRFDKETMRRSLMIRRLIILLNDIKDAHLSKEEEGRVRIDWPPKLPPGPSLPEEKDWSSWQRQWNDGAVWVRGV